MPSIGKEKIVGPWTAEELAKLPGGEDIVYPKVYDMEGNYTLDKSRGFCLPHVMFGDDCFQLAKIKYNPEIREIVDDYFDRGKFVSENVSKKELK